MKAEPIQPEQKEANPDSWSGHEEPLEPPAFPLPNLKGAKIAHIDLSGKKKKKKKAPDIRFRLFHDPWLLACHRRDEASRRWQDARSAVQAIREDAQLPSWCFGVCRSWARSFSRAPRVKMRTTSWSATVGELGIPAVRMRMDQNIQGQSVLRVMASPDALSPIRLRSICFGFEGPTALILEDLDLWDLPWMDFGSGDISDFLQMQLSRGAREAMAFIQQAIENPEVTVLVSASNLDALDTSLRPDAPGSDRLVELDYPNDEERKDIWRHAQAEHPSMRGRSGR